jgi:hypothetical protein
MSPLDARIIQATVAATKLTHLLKMSAKIRLRADPAARAAQLEALNAPVTQRRRLASINAIALDRPPSIAHRQPTLSPRPSRSSRKSRAVPHTGRR